MAMFVKDLMSDVSVEEAQLITRRGDDYRRILHAETKLEQDELIDWWEAKYGRKAEIDEMWRKAC